MISDTLELLRPKIKLCNSLEESIRQVQDLEREFLIKLGKQFITERKWRGFGQIVSRICFIMFPVRVLYLHTLYLWCWVLHNRVRWDLCDLVDFTKRSQIEIKQASDSEGKIQSCELLLILDSGFWSSLWMKGLICIAYFQLLLFLRTHGLWSVEGSTTLKFGITLQNFWSYSLVELAVLQSLEKMRC